MDLLTTASFQASHPSTVRKAHPHVAVVMDDKYRLHERDREKHIRILLPALDSPYAIDAVGEIGQDEVLARHHNSRAAHPKDKVWKGRFTGEYPGAINLLVAAGY